MVTHQEQHEQMAEIKTTESKTTESKKECTVVDDNGKV